jgi:hypothetical protein
VKKKSNKNIDIESDLKDTKEIKFLKPINDNDANKKHVSFADEQVQKKNGFQVIYSEACSDPCIRQMITEKVNQRSRAYKQRIEKEEDLYTAPSGEIDLTDLIRQWKTQLNKSDLKETLNLLHVKESKLIKRDLEKGLKLIEENSQALGSSDGFEKMGKKLGIDNKSLYSVRSENKLTPGFYFTKKNAKSYSEIKQERDSEWNEKLRQVEHNYEKIKQIDDERNQKIEWMKARAKNKEIKLKQKEESELERQQKWKERRAEKVKEMQEKAKEMKILKAKENRKNDKEVVKILKSKPLYVEIDEKFKNSVESENLQKKKQVLASLRNLYQPLDFRKIEEEQREKEDKIKEKQEERRRQLLELQKKNEETYDFRKYTSRYTERILEEDQHRLLTEQQKEEYKRTLHQKMKSYHDSIKNKYAPIVSRRNQEEIQQRLQSLEMPARFKIRQKPALSSSEKQRIYEERMKAYQKRPKQQTHTPQQPKHTKSIDYLRELRMQRSTGEVTESEGVPKSNFLVYFRFS